MTHQLNATSPRPARRRHRRHVRARARAGRELTAAARASPSSRATRDASTRRRASIRGTHGIVGDVSRKEDIHPIALQIVGALGGLDVLVNNASTLGPVPLALLADTDCEDLEPALATNLLGPFRLTKALLGALAASAREGRGRRRRSTSRATPRSRRTRAGAPTARARRRSRHLSRIWDEELAAARRRASCRSIRATWTRRCTRSRCPTPIRRR